MTFLTRFAHSSTKQLLASSRRQSSTITSPPQLLDLSGIPSSVPFSNALAFTREERLHNLKISLENSASPSRVWAHYTSVLDAFESDKLPLELHQVVLRRCTPPSQELRKFTAQRLLDETKVTNPHKHEDRFQAIISNIRAMGFKPALEDYDFVLEQFAAVGHYEGAMQVFKELMSHGIIPQPKTFGLCLQAIAHRFTLPIYKKNRQRMVVQARKMLADLLANMRSCNIPFNSSNLDLTLRVLKDTLDYEGFQSLMKWGYGIDLANPDRTPIEYSASELTAMCSPQPFSTSALNTTIDMLGRMGDTSKLVQAFEVLTQPLAKASQHLFSTFDDDEDFGVSVNVPPTSPTPHASPNTTSFNLLIRYISKTGNSTLGRHYLVQAIHLDRATDRMLRNQIWNHKPLDSIEAPHISVNRGTFLPVVGYSNRNKDMALLRWLASKVPMVMKKKQASLKYFVEVRTQISRDSSLPRSSLGHRELARGSTVSSASTGLRAALSSPSKPFDIDLHISILERDVQELEELDQDIQATLGRNTQRVKERLGRRVWAGKDVYVATSNQRSHLSREQWREVVSFKPREKQKSLV